MEHDSEVGSPPWWSSNQDCRVTANARSPGPYQTYQAARLDLEHEVMQLLQGTRQAVRVQPDGSPEKVLVVASPPWLVAQMAEGRLVSVLSFSEQAEAERYFLNCCRTNCAEAYEDDAEDEQGNPPALSADRAAELVAAGRFSFLDYHVRLGSGRI